MCTPGHDKGTFSYKTQLEPPVPPLSPEVSGSLVCSGFGAHRAVADPASRKYFGYDIDIDAAPQANTYRLTLKPLSATPKEMGLGDAIGWGSLALPQLPAPQIVSVGDTIAIDLFVNPTTGQKIVDYIRIEDLPHGVVGKQAASPERARDFRASDAELRLIETRARVNGKWVANLGDVTATAAAFYLPRHGRYIMALAPHPELGFQRAGEIRGTELTFTVGGDTISFECRDRISSGRARYNLYVRHDPAWAPKGGAARNASLVAAENSVESTPGMMVIR
jgi:hypothetical protein